MVLTYHGYHVLKRGEFIKGAPLTREKIIQRVTEEVNRLRPIKDGIEGALEKARNEIINRRLERFERNKDKLKNNESIIEKAYELILEYDMGIDLRFSRIVEKKNNFWLIHSFNYCPILMACELLTLPTTFICKELYEPSIQEVCKLIDKNLMFTRNYNKIRPDYNYCEEMFLLK